jgi:hypothetical protein
MPPKIIVFLFFVGCKTQLKIKKTIFDGEQKPIKNNIILFSGGEQKTVENSKIIKYYFLIFGIFLAAKNNKILFYFLAVFFLASENYKILTKKYQPITVNYNISQSLQ